MKKILLTLLLFFFCLLFRAGEPINDLNTAKEKAQKEHKLILLKFSGSDWCSPCVKFKKTFIDNDDFKSFSDANLIVFNADFPRQKKNTLSKEQIIENENLAEKYNPNGIFPLIILFNENGEIIQKWEKLPSESVSEFIEKLK